AAKVLNNNAHRVGVRFFDPAPEAARKLRALEKEFWPLQKLLRRAGVGNFNAKYPTDPNAIGLNLASAPHLAMRGEEYFEDHPSEPAKEAAPERAPSPAPQPPPENSEPEPPELEAAPEVKGMDGAPPPQDIKMVEFEMALPEGETEFDDDTSVWVESHEEDYRAWVVRSVKMREGFMCREISVTGCGSLFAKVSSGSRVKVFTPTTIVSSRGTRFVVRTSEHGKKTGVTVIEGEVSISVPKRAKNPMA
ncbi:MAG: FecR domain-containing protein, partial [Planctomycetes bacterium]|nr:FecR domain-containing protein [Planctomycetota bacterium]